MKYKCLIHLFSFVALAAMTACGGAETSGSHNAGYESPETELLNSPTTTADSSGQTTSDRMLIKTADLSFKTSNVDSVRAGILKSAQTYKAYIASDNSSMSEYRYSTTISIRVPNTNFEPLLYEITKGVEAFDLKDIRADDVTEEFVDVQARIKTKKEMELRYHELFKEAETIPEMLEIEKEIGALRSEIESMEGRLNFLANQVRYSTINITFYEETGVDNGWGTQFTDSFNKGWNGLIVFCISLVSIWPVLILFIVGGFFAKRYLKRLKSIGNKKSLP